MRPTQDQYFLRMAVLAATRSTCLRRSVGCVLKDLRGHVAGTGYNGVTSGQAHCNHHDPFDPLGYPFACEGAMAASGKDLDKCDAIHAEQNALLQCKDVYMIDTCYCTASPCLTCVKLLLNTSCQRIVFVEEYTHPDAKLKWIAAGRRWEQLSV